MNFIKGSILLIFSLFIGVGQAETPIRYLYVHGLTGSAFGANYYKDAHILSAETTDAFNFPDMQDGIFNPKKTCLAQHEEIVTLYNEYQKTAANDTGVVLLGVSRGAATVVNFLGRCKPFNIKAAIVESPFAHVDDVLGYRLPAIPMVIKKAIIQSMYPKYSPCGEHPINFVSLIDKNVPVAFICSKQDNLISYQSTLRLYRKALAAGHKKVHILILEEGQHAYLMSEAYQEFVHAFYRYYDLPYDAVLADKGEEAFMNSQIK